VRTSNPTYKILVGKSKVERPLGRHRYRQENNIQMNLIEIGC
jgi:hypothetical protein